MRAGPNGCIRTEEVHGAAANSGLAFTVVEMPAYLLNAHLATLVQPDGWFADEDKIPFSYADMYVFLFSSDPSIT